MCILRTPGLIKQRDEDFVGDGQARRREAHARAGAFDQTLSAQFVKARAKRHFKVGTELRTVLRLDGGEVDAIELPQAEEEFFLERLLGRDFFELLDREGVPHKFLGGGSNLLVIDGELPFVVLQLAKPDPEVVIEGNMASVDAAADLGKMVTYCAKRFPAQLVAPGSMFWQYCVWMPE